MLVVEHCVKNAYTFRITLWYNQRKRPLKGSRNGERSERWGEFIELCSEEQQSMQVYNF